MSNPSLSLRTVFEERERLEKEALKVWEDLAEQLMGLIPESLHEFAIERGWLKTEYFETDSWWTLPEWLYSIVDGTRKGKDNRERFRLEELREYKFKSFADLKRKMLLLAEAWDGLIQISIKQERGQVIIRFYATEMIPE